MQRMKGQGNPGPVPNGPKDQNYSSFQNYTNPMTNSMAAAAAASDAYMSSFYMTSTPYQAFGVGDGTWSNGGEHMQTFLGGYGGQVGYDSHNAIDGIFSSGNFGGFNAPGFNYGFPGNGDYNAWGGSDVRSGTKHYDEYYQRNLYTDDRIKTLEQGVQGIALSDPKTGQDISKDSNGRIIAANGTGNEKIGGDGASPGISDSTSLGTLNQPKKGLSWATVASQPAKPQPSRRRDKSSMPSIVPGRHLDIGTWEGKNGGPKPVAPPPAPRPAWDAPRGGSRSTSSYTTPPPRTPPQTQQVPSPQLQQAQPTLQQQHHQSPQQQDQHSPPQQQQQQQHSLSPPQQGSPQTQHQMPMQHQTVPQQQLSPQQSQQQQLGAVQQHSSPPSIAQGGGGGGSLRNEIQGAPQTGPPPLPLSSLNQTPPSARNPTLDDLHLRNEYNPKEFELSPKNARFFVIKSYSEDDIHRSIKYEIWCSTEHGNKRLDSAFREREGKGPILLFFSVNGSGHFCGLAQMMSCVDYNATSSVWAQDKWKGQFRVKWVYVKDVPNSQLRHIRLENNENKPVTNSRDTQEVPYEKGKQVLKILHLYKHTTSIFDDFIHYEKRQEESEYRRGHQSGYKDNEREDPRGNPKMDPRAAGGNMGPGIDYRDHRDHRDHHRDYHRDYHRGRGRGGRGFRGGGIRQ